MSLQLMFKKKLYIYRREIVTGIFVISDLFPHYLNYQGSDCNLDCHISFDISKKSKYVTGERDLYSEIVYIKKYIGKTKGTR